MNPYSNPTCAAANHNDVVDRMGATRPLPQGVAAGDATLAQLIEQLDVEVDNYHGSEWSFMGQMCKISRALLIPYRYQVRNKEGQATGVWATGRLLIGYVGGNGGG
jgi:hypothetical protein